MILGVLDAVLWTTSQNAVQDCSVIFLCTGLPKIPYKVLSETLVPRAHRKRLHRNTERTGTLSALCLYSDCLCTEIRKSSIEGKRL